LRRTLAAPFGLVAVLLVAFPAAVAGTERETAAPGVTPTSLLLGGTAPLSGTASAYGSVARGADAYFKYVNARGGVHKRTITYRYVDDAHDPAQTVVATRRLVEQDKVFAIFNSLGTEHNLATREYLNASKVPQLFVASGAMTWGRDAARYPQAIGFQPSYQAEGWVYGTYLARTKPRAKIALLAQNDHYGRDLLVGLKRGIQRSAARIVAAETYEVAAPDVQSQIAKLKASGADTLVLFATPTYVIQSYEYANRLGWRPLVINNALSAAHVMLTASERGGNKTVNGSVSVVFLKDPTDPAWRNDAAMRLYRSIMARYAKRANANDVNHVYGMAVAHALVEVVKKAGPNLTRAGVLKQARSLSIPASPFLLPGIQVRTKGVDQFPIEQVLLQRWEKGRWRSFGGLWVHRAT
jgi:branched-chain amino acid transport system substrate-binding protein